MYACVIDKVGCTGQYLPCSGRCAQALSICQGSITCEEDHADICGI